MNKKSLLIATSILRATLIMGMVGVISDQAAATDAASEVAPPPPPPPPPAAPPPPPPPPPGSSPSTVKKPVIKRAQTAPVAKPGGALDMSEIQQRAAARQKRQEEQAAKGAGEQSKMPAHGARPAEVPAMLKKSGSAPAIRPKTPEADEKAKQRAAELGQKKKMITDIKKCLELPGDQEKIKTCVKGLIGG